MQMDRTLRFTVQTPFKTLAKLRYFNLFFHNQQKIVKVDEIIPQACGER